MKPGLYLSGPITGLTWDQALTWRELAGSILSNKFEIFDPLKPQIIHMTDRKEVIKKTGREETKLPIHFTGSGIVTADEFYVRNSDFIMVNFIGAKTISIGSIWEMGLAWGLNKFIVTVVEPGSIHDHAFVRRRSHIFVPRYEEAIEYFVNL